MNIQRLGAIRTELGESPVWYAGKLWLMDCRAGWIYALDPDSGEVKERYEVPAPLGSFAFNGDGRSVVVALKDQIAMLDLNTGALHTLARGEDLHPHLRWNDGISLDDGSFVVGTMHVPREPGEPLLGGLYRLGVDGQFDRIDTGFGITNGPCVSPVNGRLYVGDSADRVIYSYAINEHGVLSDKQVFLNTECYQSGPDGCAFDLDGGLWVTLVRTGHIMRFDRDGKPTHDIQLPVTYPSALCFGGPDMADLFVTSIADSGRLRASGPMDGAVLKLTGLGVSGKARPVCRLQFRSSY